MLFIFTSCWKEKIDVKTACDKNDRGDYIIKWETFPPISGIVEVAQLSSPNDMSGGRLISKAPIQDGFVVVVDSTKAVQPFFELNFAGKKKAIVSNRLIETKNIIGLRDIGGYRAQNGLQLRWGMIYRSGSLSQMKEEDVAVLNQLKIKTLIDLRSKKESESSHLIFNAEQHIQIPLDVENRSALIQGIIEGKIIREEVLQRQKKIQIDIITKNTKHFIHYFEVLSNPSNYPILLFGPLGRDRVGVTIALTLAALDIDEEQIHHDYMYSNLFNDKYKEQYPLEDAPEQIQEAMSAFLTVQPGTIKSTRNYMVERYGSIDNYFKNELKISGKTLNNLKKIMYYNQD